MPPRKNNNNNSNNESENHLRQTRKRRSLNNNNNPDTYAASNYPPKRSRLIRQVINSTKNSTEKLPMLLATIAEQIPSEELSNNNLRKLEYMVNDTTIIEEKMKANKLSKEEIDEQLKKIRANRGVILEKMKTDARQQKIAARREKMRNRENAQTQLDEDFNQNDYGNYQPKRRLWVDYKRDFSLSRRRKSNINTNTGGSCLTKIKKMLVPKWLSSKHKKTTKKNKKTK